jgi:6-phosphogluconolactonase
MNVKIYTNKEKLAESLAEELYQLIVGLNKSTITIAISGGTTPYIIFEQWAKNYAVKMPWYSLHFFWIDERCVEPTNNESNYGNTKKILFDKISIPAQNIHRMRGENNPTSEAKRYASEIDSLVKFYNGIPQFDIILLGMGDDGHTASIFPPSMELLESEKSVEDTQNPYNMQNRITLTGKVINNAAAVYFVVTGKSKAQVIATIFGKKQGFESYPAAHIHPVNENLKWILDQDAASLLYLKN